MFSRWLCAVGILAWLIAACFDHGIAAKIDLAIAAVFLVGFIVLEEIAELRKA